MMPPADLARFLKERLPGVRQEYQDSPTGVLLTLDRGYFDALDAAVYLLQRCYDEMEHSGGPGWNPSGELEATLRLVLGE